MDKPSSSDEDVEIWVTCPKCGKTISVSKLCDEIIICHEKGCGTRFHAWVHKGTALTYIVSSQENASSGTKDRQKHFLDATENIRTLSTI